MCLTITSEPIFALQSNAAETPEALRRKMFVELSKGFCLNGFSCFVYFPATEHKTE
jgi:hypothetical protein